MRIFVLILLIFSESLDLYSQAYSISGRIADDKGISLKAATVFIAGSQKITITDDEGRFSFLNLSPGTYNIVVKMLGYYPATESVTVRTGSIKLNIALKVKSTVLNEVVIGNTGNLKENYELFKKNFLGTSGNARKCKILNPEVLSFSSNNKKALLKATSDEFLIIENQALGFQIKYLLRTFEYNGVTETTIYDGEAIFEDLPGTSREKAIWNKNRLKAYKGSLMHFLRSVYSKTTLREGFLTHQINLHRDVHYLDGSNGLFLEVNPRTVNFDTLVNRIDTSFVSLKFAKPLYLVYDPKTAAEKKNQSKDKWSVTDTLKKEISFNSQELESVLELFLNEAIIDRKGSVLDFRTFFINGYLGAKRIGDNLPFEYNPPGEQIISPAISAGNSNITDTITACLARWAHNLPQEKLYLHTDKPYYAVGDTIWFKTYVTVGNRHQLSAVSGAMYVDLINEKDSIEKSIKLPVTAGMAMGDFTLPDSLKEGNYRLRAYTQWMRNAGEEYFFDKTFAVGNAIDNEVIAKVDYQYKPGNVKAILNYTDEEGKALAGKEVRYQIKAAGKVIGSERVKPDANGNISINLVNDKKSNLKGAHIFTVIEPDGKKKVSKVFPIKAALSQSDVQFFPESGNLLAEITSKVGFKAVAIDGTGTEVKGTISDNEGKEITSFQSSHAGMGSFNLKPETGKTYKAKITYQDGSETTKELQPVQSDGYVLAVYPNANPDSILVRINAAEKQVQANETVNLIAHSGGEQVFASPIQVKAPITSIWLIKKDFPTGIAQFTLFNNKNEPINERIAFIRNQDQMQVKLTTVKQTYKAKEKVEIEVEAKDQTGKPTLGNFSVSVIDESKVPNNETNESTILTNILLTSDLKGYIEKPNYYFGNPTETTDKHLDLLMLTQGYRRFVWKDILKETQPEPVFKAEKLTTEISGKIVVLGTDKPAAGGKVILMSLKAGIMTETIADANGRFKFEKLLLTDSIAFTIQGRSAKDGKKVEILIDQVQPPVLSVNKNAGDFNLDINTTQKEYLANSERNYERFGKLNQMQRLKEVKITAIKQTITDQGSFKVPEGHEDQLFKLNRPELCATLAICLQGQLNGIVFIDGIPYGKRQGVLLAAKVYLNGQATDPRDMEDIFDRNVLDPPDIDKIQVVRTNIAQLSRFSKPDPNGNYPPVILIITKAAGTQKKYIPNIANITPQGFTKAREFYSPHYDKPQTPDLPDFRSTVYWNPAVKTSPEGKTKFDFFNADDKGTYKVIIEGINAAGDLGREVYRYKVE